MGGLTDALFGKGGSGTADKAIKEARTLGQQAVFRPYTVSSGTGTASYSPTSGYTTSLSQPYQDLMASSLAGAGNLFSQAASFDPTARSQQIFQEQSALLQPQFEQQATALQNRLFGSGRLGLRLAGESQGLGTGSGMVQPDALGLGRAQQQTLAQLATGSREQALGEQAQLQSLGAGMLQSGMGISALEQALMGQGLDAETARAAAAYASGQMQLSPYDMKAQMEEQKRASNAGFFGSVIGGALKGGL